jgi:hypothetical protein
MAGLKLRRQSAQMAGRRQGTFLSLWRQQNYGRPVRSGSNFDAGAAAALFQANPREMFATSELFSYDVSSDGQRFLINTQLKTEMTPMSVVLNWTAKLTQ